MYVASGTKRQDHLETFMNFTRNPESVLILRRASQHHSLPTETLQLFRILGKYLCASAQIRDHEARQVSMNPTSAQPKRVAC